MPLTGDLAHNPDMCPDWESNQQPLASQVGTQSTEPHQPGHKTPILEIRKLKLRGIREFIQDYTASVSIRPGM